MEAIILILLIILCALIAISTLQVLAVLYKLEIVITKSKIFNEKLSKILEILEAKR